MLLILISGLPCTGKTTLGRQLATDLKLPLIYRDGIKETLFDTLGWKDRAWSKQLGGASHELLFYFIECQLRAARTCVVESNFHPDFHAKRFQQLQAQYDFAPFLIECYAQGEVLMERFQQRSESGERHPGHVDHLNYDEFRAALLQGRSAPLELGGVRWEMDTTEFGAIPYAALVAALRAALDGG